MKSKLLPPFCSPGRRLDPGGVVIHYISAKNVETVENKYDMHCIRNMLIDLNRPRDEREHYMQSEAWPESRLWASAHVVISREGESWQLVRFTEQAYHAGKSIMRGRTGCNGWTFGIELVGDATSGFTDEQYKELGAVCRRLMHIYEISPLFLAGHDEVRNQARLEGIEAAKKYDPSGASDGTGNNFDWKRLRDSL